MLTTGIQEGGISNMAFEQPTRPVAGTIGATTWGVKVRNSLSYLKDEFDKNGMFLIEKKVLASPGTIEFTSIPDTYTHLKIVVNARGTYADPTLGYGDLLFLRINGDTGNNYDYLQSAYVGGAGELSGGSNGYGACYVGRITGAQATTDYSSCNVIDIPSYKDTVFFKAIHALSTRQPYSNSSTYSIIGKHGNIWKSTNAITSILLYGNNSANFIAGSTASLYGLL